MTRPIKFRAWHKQQRRMGYLDYFWNDHWYSTPQGGDGVAIWDNSNYWMDKNRDFMTIMQFTGLHDKNGKEIWEGDILRITSQYEPTDDVLAVDSLCTVRFEDGAFRTDWHDMILGRKVTMGIGNWAHEVLGDIYSNPELLK